MTDTYFYVDTFDGTFKLCSKEQAEQLALEDDFFVAKIEDGKLFTKVYDLPWSLVTNQATFIPDGEQV